MLQIDCKRMSGKLKAIKFVLLVILYSSIMPSCLLKTKAVQGKRFIIHVPIKIRTHHHTHTVYTKVHGMGKENNGDSSGGEKGSKQTFYKIMGYLAHHAGLTAAADGVGVEAVSGRFKVANHGHYRHRGHLDRGYGYHHKAYHGDGGNDAGYGEINYDDYSNCVNSVPQSGYSRQDKEDYPDIEELLDDELGDEWE